MNAYKVTVRYRSFFGFERKLQAFVTANNQEEARHTLNCNLKKDITSLPGRSMIFKQVPVDRPTVLFTYDEPSLVGSPYEFDFKVWD